MNYFPESVYHNFKAAGENVALVIDEREYSYKTMYSKIASIQKRLIDFSEECLIGIEATNHINTYASILACWFLGKGFIPLHPAHPQKRNAEIIKQAGLDVVVSFGDNSENIPHKNLTIVNKIDVETQSKLQLTWSSENEIACILFTSGSTGVPKGVPMTFKNINCTLESFFLLDYKLSEKDTFLQMFELTFDMSLLSFLPAFVLGATVFTVGNNKIKYFESVNLLQKHGITFAAMVPSTLSLLRPYFSKISLPQLKYSLLGGEPFYEDLAKEWQKVVPNANIINVSGPTEITMACMGYDIDKTFTANKTHNGILAFGKSWPKTTAIVVDENLLEVKTGEIGELCFAGNHVMSGYLEQSELNARVFFDIVIDKKTQRFYRTGDMAYVDEEGIFYTCGRRDKQVKIQGFKVELEEIDNTIRKLAGVRNSCALVPGSSNVSEIVLFVETERISEDEIQSCLKESLPYYMLPARIKVLSKFPYSINGKIDREKLKELNNKEMSR